MNIYCCNCEREVEARLTDGSEIYPGRDDLSDLPFWICDDCGNYVGCHHKTRDRTRPLGVIASPEIREARRYIHAILDPLWQMGYVRRTTVYRKIARKLGLKEYHTSELRTIEEARDAYRAILDIRDELNRTRQ